MNFWDYQRYLFRGISLLISEWSIWSWTIWKPFRWYTSVRLLISIWLNKTVETAYETEKTRSKAGENIENDYLPKFNKTSSEVTKMHKLALERAWINRDFEINKYWQRAAYFWGFIVLLFGAYLTIIGGENSIASKRPAYELYAILLGIIFSLSWYLVNLGSKRWQENWEGHIDALENDVTGPIYKSIYKTGTFYSVSKINTILSLSVLLVWIGLFVKFFNDPQQRKYKLADFDYYISWEIALPILVTLWICFQLIRTGKNTFKAKSGYFFERPIK